MSFVHVVGELCIVHATHIYCISVRQVTVLDDSEILTFS